MTYYTSWITTSELIQLIENEKWIQPNTINILKGGATGEKKRNENKNISEINKRTT